MTDYERFGEYRPSERSPWGLGITLLLVGLGAGALTALLLAPKTGRQTRKALRRKYEDTMDTLTARADDLRERSSEWIGKAKEFAGVVGDAADEAQERVRVFGKEARKRVR